MRTRFMALAAAAATVLCSPAQDLYRVAGVVIDTQTGTPLPRAQVMVRKTGSTQKVASLNTGDDGKFAFNLPLGKFNIYAGTRDVLQTLGLHSPSSNVGTSVITGPDRDTGNIVFRWFPRAAISGKILDESGEPVESALVQLLRSTVSAGRSVASNAGWTRTDDRGEYRFGLVRGGSYYLAVTAEPWYAKANIAGQPDTATSVAYAAVYYPNTPDISRGAALVLTPGNDARTDSTLSPVTGATVTVPHDVKPGMTGTLSLLTEGIGGSEAFQRQENFYGSMARQNVSGVPPGHYVVRIAGSSANVDYSARQPLDVNGSNVTVELAMRRAPTVTGTIQFKNPSAKRGSLFARLIRNDTNSVLATAVHADGSFTFPSVAAQRYRFAIGNSDGLFASEIRVEGADIRDGVMDFVEGQSVTLRIVASDETGRVKGFAMQGGKPAAGVMVVFALATESAGQATNRGFFTDTDGSFDLEALRSGDYLAFATEDAEIEYQNPAATRPYLAIAKPIHVGAHGTYSLDLPVTAKRAGN
jgi:5-hydroxyisourate hydrolase-like protein (transthyretin family)